MNDESQIQSSEPLSPAVIPASEPVVRREDGNVAVTALVPEQMSSCQSALIAWCSEKVVSMKAEAEELSQAFESAKAKKWSSATLRKHATLATERVEFYEKMLAALQHGFVIVPNFPISLFAIRTEADKPSGHARLYTYQSTPIFEQESQSLPVGEGEYKNPFPHVADWQTFKTADGKDAKSCFPTVWNKFTFPITMAKPQIMEAADRTMALKIFDQLGILPAETHKARRAKGDPLIVGQLLDPRGRIVTFMIAWHLDTRVL